MENMENTHNVEKNECGCGCACSDQAATAIETKEEKAPRRAYVPAVDIVDAGNEIHLIADVPGVPEGAVDLNLEKSVLTLVAVPSDGVVAGKKLVYSEYGVGEYRRSFSLSDDIDKENIVASLKDGVLRIRLPKTAPVSRKINVSSN